MSKEIEHITYSDSIFDKFIDNKDLDSWGNLGFPEIMWGLGFEMDCNKSYKEYLEHNGLKLKEPMNERDRKRNYLYVLEHADRQVVGNFLFSYWRYLTHWAYGYNEYDADFLYRIIKLLKKSYENQ